MVKILREKSKGNECSILFFCKNSPHGLKSTPTGSAPAGAFLFRQYARLQALCGHQP